MNPQTEYLVILEPAGRNWSAYAPDVLGCISTGPTEEQTRRNFADALQGHLDWMREDGDPIPPPAAETDAVTVAITGQPPRRYLTILQPTTVGGWSVSPADVPDLVLDFSTRAGALRLLQAALQSHLEALMADGEPVPEPASEASAVTVYLADLSVAA